ncbi:GIY-YIG nuclease family protein [Patescibacteria group bacterium]|nr:GIY-YIG nuclease family protein [Patescibacteria group bacterium]
MRKYYYVYFVASINRVLYVGYTDCLIKRINQHKKGFYDNAFSKKYQTNRLVYWEPYYTKEEALNREKQIKKWSRKKKVVLIDKHNYEWRDIYGDVVEIGKTRLLRSLK